MDRMLDQKFSKYDLQVPCQGEVGGIPEILSGSQDIAK